LSRDRSEDDGMQRIIALIRGWRLAQEAAEKVFGFAFRPAPGDPGFVSSTT
jgi:hypothetical protein